MFQSRKTSKNPSFLLFLFLCAAWLVPARANNIGSEKPLLASTQDPITTQRYCDFLNTSTLLNEDSLTEKGESLGHLAVECLSNNFYDEEILGETIIRIGFPENYHYELASLRAMEGLSYYDISSYCRWTKRTDTLLSSAIEFSANVPLSSIDRELRSTQIHSFLKHDAVAQSSTSENEETSWSSPSYLEELAGLALLVGGGCLASRYNSSPKYRGLSHQNQQAFDAIVQVHYPEFIVNNIAVEPSAGVGVVSRTNFSHEFSRNGFRNIGHQFCDVTLNPVLYHLPLEIRRDWNGSKKIVFADWNEINPPKSYDLHEQFQNALGIFADHFHEFQEAQKSGLTPFMIHETLTRVVSTLDAFKAFKSRLHDAPQINNSSYLKQLYSTWDDATQNLSLNGAELSCSQEMCEDMQNLFTQYCASQEEKNFLEPRSDLKSILPRFLEYSIKAHADVGKSTALQHKSVLSSNNNRLKALPPNEVNDFFQGEQDHVSYLQDTLSSRFSTLGEYRSGAIAKNIRSSSAVRYQCHSIEFLNKALETVQAIDTSSLLNNEANCRNRSDILTQRDELHKNFITRLKNISEEYKERANQEYWIEQNSSNPSHNNSSLASVSHGSERSSSMTSVSSSLFGNSQGRDALLHRLKEAAKQEELALGYANQGLAASSNKDHISSLRVDLLSKMAENHKDVAAAILKDKRSDMNDSPHAGKVEDRDGLRSRPNQDNNEKVYTNIIDLSLLGCQKKQLECLNKASEAETAGLNTKPFLDQAEAWQKTALAAQNVLEEEKTQYSRREDIHDEHHLDPSSKRWWTVSSKILKEQKTLTRYYYDDALALSGQEPPLQKAQRSKAIEMQRKVIACLSSSCISGHSENPQDLKNATMYSALADEFRASIPVEQTLLALESQKNSLTRIFHTDRNEEAAKADGVSQTSILTPGCMSPYRPSHNVSLTQDPSDFPVSAGDRCEIFGLSQEKAYTHNTLLGNLLDQAIECHELLKQHIEKTRNNIENSLLKTEAVYKAEYEIRELLTTVAAGAEKDVRSTQKILEAASSLTSSKVNERDPSHDGLIHDNGDVDTSHENTFSHLTLCKKSIAANTEDLDQVILSLTARLEDYNTLLVHLSEDSIPLNKEKSIEVFRITTKKYRTLVQALLDRIDARITLAEQELSRSASSAQDDHSPQISVARKAVEYRSKNVTLAEHMIQASSSEDCWGRHREDDVRGFSMEWNNRLARLAEHIVALDRKAATSEHQASTRVEYGGLKKISIRGLRKITNVLLEKVFDQEIKLSQKALAHPFNYFGGRFQSWHVPLEETHRCVFDRCSKTLDQLITFFNQSKKNDIPLGEAHKDVIQGIENWIEKARDRFISKISDPQQEHNNYAGISDEVARDGLYMNSIHELLANANRLDQLQASMLANDLPKWHDAIATQKCLVDLHKRYLDHQISSQLLDTKPVALASDQVHGDLRNEDNTPSAYSWLNPDHFQDPYYLKEAIFEMTKPTLDLVAYSTRHLVKDTNEERKALLQENLNTNQRILEHIASGNVWHEHLLTLAHKEIEFYNILLKKEKLTHSLHEAKDHFEGFLHHLNTNDSLGARLEAKRRNHETFIEELHTHAKFDLAKRYENDFHTKDWPDFIKAQRQEAVTREEKFIRAQKESKDIEELVSNSMNDLMRWQTRAEQVNHPVLSWWKKIPYLLDPYLPYYPSDEYFFTPLTQDIFY